MKEYREKCPGIVKTRGKRPGRNVREGEMSYTRYNWQNPRHMKKTCRDAIKGN